MHRVVGSFLILIASAGSAMAQNTWDSSKAPMPLARWNHASAATGGYLYVFGGESENGWDHSNYRYDAVSDSWTARGYITDYDGMSPVGWMYSGGAAANGKIYQCGGTVYVYNVSAGDNTCWEYDPTADRWTKLSGTLPGIFGSCQATEAGGKVYVASRYGSVVRFCELDPGTGAVTAKADHARAVSGFYLGGLNGKVYLAGGRVGTTNTTETYEYDPSANTWTLKSGVMPAGNYGGASACAKGKFFAIGGSVSPFTQVYGYDPATDAWQTYASAPTALMMGSAATLVANGATRIHYTGGLDLVNYWMAAGQHVYAPPSLPKPADPSGLFMRTPAGAALAHGAFTGPNIVLGAQLADATGAQVSLQVEVAAQSAAFTGNPTHWTPMAGPGEASVQVGVTGGPWKWRARCWSSNEELNAGGWIDFGPSDPDFTVDSTAPTAPTPTGPVSSVVTTAYLIPKPVTFTWTEAMDDSSEPMTYEIQVSSSPSLATIDRVGAGTGSSGAVFLEPSATPFYWRVRAVDAFGNAGPWSGIASFTLAYAAAEESDGGGKCAGSASSASSSLGLTLAAVLLASLRILRGRPS